MVLVVVIRRALGTVAAMSPQLVMFAIAVGAVVFFGQRFGFFGEGISLASGSAASLAPGEPRDVELFTLLPRDAIRSIDDPEFVRADEALITPSTPVIGVAIGNDARAYPLRVLAAHEIVNDFVGGRPIAVTYCPLCLTGIVFDRNIDGVVSEFGVSGKLLMNVLVMYDRDTGSLWSQILGESISGDRKGDRLVIVDSLQTTWGTWRLLHPNSLVLDSDIEFDSYAGYYSSDASGVHGDFIDDDRLAPKAVIVGVVVGRTARAYPLSLSIDQPIINDVIADLPVVTVFVPDGLTGLLFERRVQGRVLTFAEAGAGAHLEMVDIETGSRWNRLSGEAIDGPLRGVTLTRVPATNSFWFGWRDFYPQTTVYGLDAGPGTSAAPGSRDGAPDEG